VDDAGENDTDAYNALVNKIGYLFRAEKIAEWAKQYWALLVLFIPDRVFCVFLFSKMYPIGYDYFVS